MAIEVLPITVLEQGFVRCETQEQVDKLAELAEKAGYRGDSLNKLHTEIEWIKRGFDGFGLTYFRKTWFLTGTKNTNRKEYQYSDFIRE